MKKTILYWLAISAFSLSVSILLISVILSFNTYIREVSVSGPFKQESEGTKALHFDLRSTLPFRKLLSTGGDTLQMPYQSTLRITANEIELTSSHALHDQIRTEGNGVFSHWGDDLIFSLPGEVENADRTQLIIQYAVRLRPKLTSMAIIVFLFSGLFLSVAYVTRLLRADWRGKNETYALIGLGCAVFVVALYYPVKERKTGNPGYGHAAIDYLSGWGDSRLKRKEGESDLDFVLRMNSTVHKATYHCGPTDDRRLVEHLVFILDDYFGSGGTLNSRHQGFLTPDLRCGLCHQRAYILAQSLVNSGIHAIVQGLNGHVVTLVELNGTKLLFDPDYGVGPIDYVNYDAVEIRNLYYRAGVNLPAEVADFIVTQKDDDEYYTMTHLGDLSLRQDRLLAAVYVLSIIVFFFGSLMIYLGVKRVIAAKRLIE